MGAGAGGSVERQAAPIEADAITTSIDALDAFYFAEAYHQQYLHKNPRGYCGLQGTGVRCI